SRPVSSPAPAKLPVPSRDWYCGSTSTFELRSYQSWPCGRSAPAVWVERAVPSTTFALGSLKTKTHSGDVKVSSPSGLRWHPSWSGCVVESGPAANAGQDATIRASKACKSARAARNAPRVPASPSWLTIRPPSETVLAARELGEPGGAVVNAARRVNARRRFRLEAAAIGTVEPHPYGAWVTLR